MASVPVLERLEVDGYGLYPGTRARPGLHVDLDPGLTLVLGANGLGKTTLVTMMYRMCSGPSEMRGTPSADVGGRNLEPVGLSTGARRLFANRVADGAVDASATLTMTVGQQRFRVSRSLKDLRLESLEVDDQDLEPLEEEFQKAIADAAEVPTFGDWLLLLRYLVFYFEDRRALVWDPSAQRQIIRLLFFPSNRSREWAERERAIQQLDSKMRNLQAVVTRQERDLAKDEAASHAAPAVRQELETLVALQEIDQPRLDDATDALLTLEAERDRARLESLTAERDHEEAFRDVERLQLQVVDAAFPTGDETAKYLFAQLMADGDCLACGQNASSLLDDLRTRIHEDRCVICGQAVEPRAATPISQRALKKAQRSLEATADRLESTSAVLVEAEEAYYERQVVVQELYAAVAERRARMDELIRRLPASEAAIHDRHSELSGLRAEVESLRSDLAVRRSSFRDFIGQMTMEVAEQASAVKQTFDAYARAFLIDDTSLIWAPHRDMVGQSGQQVDYPGFELAMEGAGFRSATRRSEPDQVSESQREFIDLAFRMTLMGVGTATGVGTLVIDAPESSLDAVFVRRAAEVLTQFADGTTENRLLITSNLIDGDLIPHLLQNAGIRSARNHRVVDLLRIAAPTAATTQWHAEYADVRAEVFRRATQVHR